MKKMKKMKKIKKEIKKRLIKESNYFENMETEPAPSGEWGEYNYSYMIQDAVVDTWSEVYKILGGKI